MFSFANCKWKILYFYKWDEKYPYATFKVVQ